MCWTRKKKVIRRFSTVSSLISVNFLFFFSFHLIFIPHFDHSPSIIARRGTTIYAVLRAIYLRVTAKRRIQNLIDWRSIFYPINQHLPSVYNVSHSVYSTSGNNYFSIESLITMILIRSTKVLQLQQYSATLWRGQFSWMKQRCDKYWLASDEVYVVNRMKSARGTVNLYSVTGRFNPKLVFWKCYENVFTNLLVWWLQRSINKFIKDR